LSRLTLPDGSVQSVLNAQGRLAAYRPVARNWTEFRPTPPDEWFSDDERLRFREYWMKEALVRLSIWCDLTTASCPDQPTVDRILASLFDDVARRRPDETIEEVQARFDRYRKSREEFVQLFGETPQSIFSFAGLEQHRGPDVPKPPLEPDDPDGGR
ncbi:MAG: hypothetical protein HY906_02565, partial [Deltaproteobacteria bacterium]|nr:hypothetical protein [Deltaproteobacteria bacterium]